MNILLENLYSYPPSVYSHALNGILLGIAIFLTIINYRKIRQLEINKKIELILFFSLVIGVHGLSHMGLEYVYNYNPWNWIRK